MKTVEEILKQHAPGIILFGAGDGSVHKWNAVIKAMEEYAIQSVDCACANAVLQMETLEAENRAHIDCINGQEYKIMELEQQTTLLAQKCSDYADQITQCEIDRANLVAMTLERDELDEKYKEAVRDRKEYKRLYEEYKQRYDFAVIDGTDLRQKLEQLQEQYDKECDQNTWLAQKCSEYADKITELEDTLGLKYNPHGESNWDEPDPGDLTEYHGDPDEE